MEDPEVPIEHLHEHIHEAVHENHSRWSMAVAISTALMAAFAAVSSLMAGHQSNEALITQVKASDQWSYYNAKGIKAEVADAVLQLRATKNDSSKAAVVRKEKLKKDQEKIQEKATELEKESEEHLNKDMLLARSVTFFQIAISLSAVSLLSKKKSLWYVGLVLFALGILQFAIGLHPDLFGWFKAV